MRICTPSVGGKRGVLQHLAVENSGLIAAEPRTVVCSALSALIIGVSTKGEMFAITLPALEECVGKDVVLRQPTTGNLPTRKAALTRYLSIALMTC
jgi:hypothetical protein